MTVLGFSYLEAIRLLHESGQKVARILLTSPPGFHIGQGDLRVVGERIREDGIELVLAYESYTPLPQDSGRKASGLEEGRA